MTPPSGRRPRRGHRPRKERRVIRVLTEGKVTEPSYLIAWARRHRHSISLSLPESGMAPETLVDHARQHMRRRRRSRRGDQDFDEIWCVFDIDLHPNVPTAIHNARQSGIEVAVSNPCIELWLVLHVEDQTAYINRRNVQRRANELQLTFGKGIPTARGVRCSMSSRPPDSAPKRWISGTPATDRRPGRTQALTSGGSSIGSDPLAIGNHTEMRSPLRSPVTRRPSPCREPASRHAPH